MDFLNPSLFGTQARFSSEFQKPIGQGSKETLERLRKATKPFMLRGSKQDKDLLPDLPEKLPS
jgi:SNF2 family DNA or RNA helicase